MRVRNGLPYILLLLVLASVTMLRSLPVSSQESNYYLVCVTAYRSHDVLILNYYAVPLWRVMELVKHNRTLLSFIHKAVEGCENLSYLGAPTSPILKEILKESMPQCLSRAEGGIAGVWLVNGLKQIQKIKMLHYPLTIKAASESKVYSETIPTHTTTVIMHTTKPASASPTLKSLPVTTEAGISTPTHSAPPATSSSKTSALEMRSYSKPMGALVSKPMAALIGIAVALLAILVTYELITRK